MSQIDDLHRQAMECAQMAMAAKYMGRKDEAEAHTRRAFELEKRAAELIAPDIDGEPSRSVLHRSAAALAYQCAEYREAERLVAAGLSGNPPDEIADELRDIYSQVHFMQHLAERGMEIVERSIECLMDGKGIAPGLAPSDRIVRKMQSMEKAIVRTGERQRGLPFREAGPPKGSVRDDYEFYWGVGKGSFVVTIQVGRSKVQEGLPGIQDVDGVVDEVLGCLDLYSQSHDEQLRERIPDADYYENFVGLARQLEPDGVEIEKIGFRVNRGGRHVTVALTGKRDHEGRVPPARGKRGPQLVTVTGDLKMADDREPRRRGKRKADLADPVMAQQLDLRRIIVVDQTGVEHKVAVKEAQMRDVVAPYFRRTVTVSGFRKGGVIHLEGIDEA